MSKRHELESWRPDLGSDMLILRSERSDIGSERSDLRSERPDFGSDRFVLGFGGLF